MPRLLLLLSQFPADPSSGAARSMLSIARILRRNGWDVRALGTAANDHATSATLSDLLDRTGAAGASASGVGIGSTIEVTVSEIPQRLLQTGHHRSHTWDFDALLNRAFGLALEQELSRGVDVVLTFGASDYERARQRQCRAAGAKVVLGVRQHGYYNRRAFEHIDAVLTPSEFLRRCYLERVGVDSVALPVPMETQDVIVEAGQWEPLFVTMINPIPEKGLYFMVTLADVLARARPDIPQVIIESRGRAAHLISAAHRGGIDLSGHESLMIAPAVGKPRMIFQQARVLLVPSVWEEPSGRVAVEAMLNGVVPLVSNRGGLGETVGEGGMVLPLPDQLTVETSTPVAPEAVATWVAEIERLYHDQAYFEQRSRQGREYAKGVYLSEALSQRYVSFFAQLLR